ncbi:hypothetical protein E2C01_098363 [Portunus trituberculatus]|uniref:Uncharacterized protein n=1 Tax=Portunus trituberculatus TaxID=210409 RepID=A0A5B7K6U4_PORTR|nr:hypothetical protein [Portunus trituberculatus]
MGLFSVFCSSSTSSTTITLRNTQTSHINFTKQLIHTKKERKSHPLAHKDLINTGAKGLERHAEGLDGRGAGTDVGTSCQ